MSEEFTATIFGKPVHLRGREVFLWLLVAILLAVVVWLFKFSMENWGRPFHIAEEFAKHDAAIAEQHRDYQRQAAEMTYILAVCLNTSRKEECNRLNLDMPDTLYRKMRRE